jgi:hypothetical protein
MRPLEHRKWPVSRPEETPRQETQAFLTEARRLSDHHWRRGDAFERKAVGVLGFTGIIIGLLVNAVPIVAGGRGVTRIVALVFGGISLVALAVSGVSALFVLKPRDSKGVSVTEVQEMWRDRGRRNPDHYVADDSWHANMVEQDITEKYLHGMSEGPSPVASLSLDAKKRGDWFHASVIANVVALLSILVVAVTTAIGRLQ